MKTETYPEILLLGSQGYIGTLISKFSPFRERITPLVHLSDLGKMSGPFTIINAAGRTSSKGPVGNKRSDLSDFDSNYLILQELFASFATRLSHFIQLSSSLIAEPTILEKSPYVQSKYRAEQIIENFNSKNDTQVSVLRLPSIWSKHLLKKESLLFDLVRNQSSSDNLFLTNGDRVCHIATDETLNYMLKSAFSTRDRTVSCPEDMQLITTAKQIRLFLEKKDPPTKTIDVSFKLNAIYQYWLNDDVNLRRDAHDDRRSFIVPKISSSHHFKST